MRGKRKRKMQNLWKDRRMRTMMIIRIILQMRKKGRLRQGALQKSPRTTRGRSGAPRRCLYGFRKILSKQQHCPKAPKYFTRVLPSRLAAPLQPRRDLQSLCSNLILATFQVQSRITNLERYNRDIICV